MSVSIWQKSSLLSFLTHSIYV